MNTGGSLRSSRVFAKPESFPGQASLFSKSPECVAVSECQNKQTNKQITKCCPVKFPKSCFSQSGLKQQCTKMIRNNMQSEHRAPVFEIQGPYCPP